MILWMLGTIIGLIIVVGIVWFLFFDEVEEDD
jgi:hypothetical protein